MPAQSIESTTVRLPRQVVQKSERIQALIDARNAPPADPEATPTAASPAAPIAEPTASTPKTPEEPGSNGTQPIGLRPGDPRENDVGYWKQRASVVSGMLRQAREVHAEEVATLRGQVRELREQLSTKESIQPPASPAVDLASMFTDEQRQQYGDDQLAAIVGPILAKVRQEAQELVEARTKPLKEQREDERKDELKRKWNAFADQLVALVPDALEIDKTPEWLEWLELPDEVTGYTHRQMLKQHENRFDAPKVARLFEKYKAQMGMAPAPAAAPAAPAAPAPRPPVAPSARGGSGGGDLPPPSPALAPLSKAEMRDGFKKAALGKMSAEERRVFDARVALSQTRA